MSETVDRPRVRGIWGDACSPLTLRELIAAEVNEAFAPVQEWRRATHAERTPALHALVLDTLTSLAWWGWAVDVTRGGGRWTVTVSRAYGNQKVRARIVGVDYIDAIWRLGEKLAGELADMEGAA